MSTDDTTNATTSSDRRDAVREKAQQVRVRQSRAKWARRSAIGVTLVAAVAAVAVVVTWTVSTTAGRPQLTPANLSHEGGFPVTSITGSTGTLDASLATPSPTPADATATPAPDATPTATAAAVEIDVYVDYLSPGAREWQVANSDQLSSWLSQGAATLSYHPVSMLTAKSNGTKYSLRAAGAAACVATHSPDLFFPFNQELLMRQPAIDSDGFSDEELADIAQATGVTEPKRIRACIEDGSFISWVKESTESAVSGIPDTNGLALTGTPMIVVNGEAYVGELTDPAEFSQFVLTSSSGAFYRAQATPTPTATPVPTASPTP
ncbi:DsbA family protein [Microbacterium invictum]|uniref:Protein-disulfide isomerase n=1 Tax=Microbacterium invictum TaxID=515415 RepID=A0AA40SLP5_9MICO|nr:MULTISPECIES: thioredoxin domain-containing protein [Microbacterium]MBB4138487.1 protein-disulfide isomerase [Microbacterium invictum]